MTEPLTADELHLAEVGMGPETIHGWVPNPGTTYYAFFRALETLLQELDKTVGLSGAADESVGVIRQHLGVTS